MTNDSMKLQLGIFPSHSVGVGGVSVCISAGGGNRIIPWCGGGDTGQK